MGSPEILGEANKPIYERVVNELIKIEPYKSDRRFRMEGSSRLTICSKRETRADKNFQRISHFIRFINFCRSSRGEQSGFPLFLTEI
jgi:hypothetical protein